MRFRRLHEQRDGQPHGNGEQGEQEGVVPAQQGQETAQRREPRRAHGEDAGIVAHGLTAFPALIEVADHGSVEDA